MPELEALRQAHHRLTDVALASGESHLLDDVRGDMLELIAEFEVGDARQVGLKVRRAPDGSEETAIFYDVDTQELVFDGQRSSLDREIVQREFRGDFLEPVGETVTLRLFLDRSVIEVFAGPSTCITGRTYPTRPDSLGLALFAEGGAARLRSLDVWQMRNG